MSHTSMILSALLTMAMLLFFAPNIFAMNRGRILRNIALWLALFLGLALFYQNFGPESPNPLFQLPEAMSGMHREEPAPANGAIDKDGKKDSDKEPADAGTQGFTPPKEE